MYRGINEFKEGSNLELSLKNYANGDLLADSHSILNR
jgi:hypothetical protein